MCVRFGTAVTAARLWATALLVAGMMVANAHAAVLQIDGTGELIGATGVDVDGTLYDVEFLDGTCVGLFFGCNAPGDFAFQTVIEANDAAVALAIQVFVGPFLTTPSLTRGCEGIFFCDVLVPYSGDGSVFQASIVEVLTNGSFNFFSGATGTATFDFAAREGITWARFTIPSTPVPEPGTIALLGTGLLGLFMTRRKRKS